MSRYAKYILTDHRNPLTADLAVSGLWTQATDSRTMSLPVRVCCPLLRSRDPARVAPLEFGFGYGA